MTSSSSNRGCRTRLPSKEKAFNQKPQAGSKHSPSCQAAGHGPAWGFWFVVAGLRAKPQAIALGCASLISILVSFFGPGYPIFTLRRS
jgi:hypothetical protein